MSTNQFSTKWISLIECPASKIHCPIGVDRDNYIVIDAKFKINCIYKYDIDNDKWIKMDGFNVENIQSFSAALDVKKQILFVSSHSCVTQIELNNNNITNHTHNVEMYMASAKSIIINNSLFIIGGMDNNSIFKWDSQK
eukprot:413124_1